SAVCFPRYLLPRRRKFMLAFVTTHGDSEQWIIPVLYGPIPHGCGDFVVVIFVKLIAWCGAVPACLCFVANDAHVIRWIKEYSSQSDLVRYARAKHSRPVATANTNAPQSFGKS